MVAGGYGGPEVLALQDIELPSPGDGQVLVDVRAAGTNPIDRELYGGEMGRDPARLPIRLGMEVAGVVTAITPGSTGYAGPLTIGDEVIVTNIDAGYAEWVLTDAAEVGHQPSNLSFEQAAGLLMGGETAWHLLTNPRVGMGDTVLIHGGTASPARHELTELAGAGRLEVTVDEVFPLIEAGEAHRLSADRARPRKSRTGPLACAPMTTSEKRSGIAHDDEREAERERA
jgi:NADPH:quinone reductase-like Zn-dependent oxidoreductase